MSRSDEFIKRVSGIFTICLLFASLQTLAQPVASFSMDVQTGCAPLTVNFTNTSSGANSYSWSFDNSNSSTLPDPATVYLSPGSYTVTLTATNTVTGEQSTSSQLVTVVNDPVASFTSATTAACEDINTICFTNTSQYAATYTWDFGDGNTSNAINACHTYTNPGIYTIKLIAVSPYGCTDIETQTNYITIHPEPAVNFSSNVQSTCNASEVFTFTSSIPGATSWTWDFGDLTTSALQNPTHTYSAPGTYTVSLIATNSFGCTDTAIYNNYINIGSTLVPSFTISDTGGCAPFNVSFDCNVANATSWLWDFGDGNSSIQEDPAHTFTTPGAYDISLSVTTQSGCNGSVTLPGLIVVDNLPVPSFTVTQDTGCAPYNVQFTNTSAGASSYIWDFGFTGGTSTQTNPSFTYNNPWTYSVSLTAYSPNGCVADTTYNNFITVYDPVATFTGAPLAGCPGMSVAFATSAPQTGIVSWQWSFGDGTFSTQQNPTHIYNTPGFYTVWLVVTNAFGCKDTVYKPNYVRVYASPMAYVMPDTIRVCQNAGQPFVCPVSGSNSWSWNFGDGTTSTTQHPTHVYSLPGIYTVTLTTGMPGGCTQNFNPFAIVQVVPHNPQPIVVTYINRCKPYTASFSTSTPNVTAYEWHFGDGTTSTLANPTHMYAASGTYTVQVELTIGSGCVDVLSTNVTFGHSNPIQFSGFNNCRGTAHSFNVLGAAAYASFLWNFGDGTTSTQASASHIYNTAGTYNFSLITTDTMGCIDTFTLAQPIQVWNPQPSFSVTGSTTGCLSLPVQFQNNSTGATSYLWDFGDGTTDTIANPSHTYAASGVYTVKLTAKNNICSNTQTQTNLITIVAPQCNFMFSSTALCLPVTVTFTDLSAGAVSWLWDFGDGNTSTVQNPVHTFTTPPSGQVSLTITDINGCTATRTKTNINYYSASASCSAPVGCDPMTVAFTDLSNMATGWQWSFGDGNTSTAQNPVHIYNGDGVYDVTLVATFPGGCVDTVHYPAMITVSTPVADFVAPAASGCSPITISFSNLSTDAVTYLWDFGDGSTSTNVNPTHIYNIPGYYNIRLIAFNSTGCADTMLKQSYIAIPGVYSNFSLSANTGCETLTVQFTDSSINAIDWTWNFGDGGTSVLSNPQHTYTDTGSYVVTLITHDTLGCTSVYTYPLPVQIFPNPDALATSADTEGCQPYGATFANLSQYASYYTWHFGNGDSSQLADPAYIYNDPGIFNPYLVAYTGANCSDTAYLNPVTVHAHPVVSFTPNALQVCNPDTVIFTNTSTNLENPVFNWVYGNGTSSAAANGGVMYTDSGNYSVTLYIINTFGCNDSASANISVNPTPVAIASTNDTAGCSPVISNFSNSTLFADTYQWIFGDGGSSVVAQPVYSYIAGGYFQPILIASNHHGCVDTVLTEMINVLQSPNAAFSASDTTVCPGNTVQFNNESTDTVNANYQWDFTFTGSTLMNPNIVYSNPGFYDVALLVTNANGCADSLSSLLYIEVYDSVPPAANPILSASVVNDTLVEVTWENSTANDLATYNLYRYDPVTGSYALVYVDINPQVFSTSPATIYNDRVTDTKINTYTYILQSEDRCAYRLPITNLTAHTTMNVTALQAGTNIDVSWTAYGGCAVSGYQISRTEVANGSVQTIANVPASTLNYTDSTLMCPFEYQYKIVALDLCGNAYNASSDTSVAAPENILAEQHVDVIRSTTVNNKEVLTEWSAPAIHPNRVQHYEILRSADGINYTPIAIVPPQVTSFIDDSVDIEGQNYYYKINVVNDCNLYGEEGFEGSSIRLQGDWRNYHTRLMWTKYRQWEFDVYHYTIEKQNIFGVWEPIINVDGTTTGVDLNE